MVLITHSRTVTSNSLILLDKSHISFWPIFVCVVANLENSLWKKEVRAAPNRIARSTRERIIFAWSAEI